MSCKVGNQTNSQDPQAVNSRVFVGNLNTFQCNKTNVERRFQRYGRIAGISMHKGYAFIQFTNPFDARSACLGEDGRLLWGQTLDVNMVAEPKSHQTGRKRQNHAKTGNDWDYYYDSYYAQVGYPPTPRLIPPMKRARHHVPPSARPSKTSTAVCNNNNNNNSLRSTASLTGLKSYSTPDILICGNCRELFTEIEQLMDHKKNYCKLRFTCKCHVLNGCKPSTVGDEPASLLCSQCKDSFHSAWDLMVHVQTAHLLNIYQLGSDVKNEDSVEGKGENGVNGADSGTMTVNEHHNHHQTFPLTLTCSSHSSASSTASNSGDAPASGENHDHNSYENNSSASDHNNIGTTTQSTSASGSAEILMVDDSRVVLMTYPKTPTPPETQIQFQMNGNGNGNNNCVNFPTEASTQTLAFPMENVDADVKNFHSDSYARIIPAINGSGGLDTSFRN